MNANVVLSSQIEIWNFKSPYPIDRKFPPFELLGLFKNSFFNSNSAILTLARTIGENCQLLFRTEATIYSKIR